MKMRNVICVCAVVGLAIPTALSFANDGMDSFPAASKASEGLTASTERPNKAELAQLEQHVARVEAASERAGERHGPSSDQLLATVDQAKLLVNADGVRIAAAPSQAGDICFTTSVNGRDQGTGCSDDFLDGGALYFSGPDGEFGLVDNGVTKVELALRSGETVELPIVNNTFAWTDGVDTDIKSLTVTRKGVETVFAFEGRPTPDKLV